MIDGDRVEEVAAIARELGEIHETVRRLVGVPDARLMICNRIEAVAERVRALDLTPR